MKTNGYGRALPPILRAGETAESWPERRAELMTLLREQVYGFSPEETPVVTVESEEEKPVLRRKGESWQGCSAGAIRREVVFLPGALRVSEGKAARAGVRRSEFPTGCT